MPDEAIPSFAADDGSAVEPQELARGVIRLVEEIKALTIPEFYAFSREQLARYEGLKYAFTLITGVKMEETPKVAVFSEEAAANKNLGNEALKLLEDYELCSGDDFDEWNTKRKQLLQVWRVNSKGEAIRAAVERAKPEVLNGICAEGKFHASSMRDLWGMKFMQDAIEDRPGLEFVRLILVGRLLKAEYRSPGSDDSIRRNAIAELENVPAWLNIQRA